MPYNNRPGQEQKVSCPGTGSLSTPALQAVPPSELAWFWRELTKDYVQVDSRSYIPRHATDSILLSSVDS